MKFKRPQVLERFHQYQMAGYYRIRFLYLPRDVGTLKSYRDSVKFNRMSGRKTTVTSVFYYLNRMNANDR